MRRQQKITLGEMRESGVRGLLVYCSDYRCSHSTQLSADQWPDDVRLSDLESRFTCQACGTAQLSTSSDGYSGLTRWRFEYPG